MSVAASVGFRVLGPDQPFPRIVKRWKVRDVKPIGNPADHVVNVHLGEATRGEDQGHPGQPGGQDAWEPVSVYPVLIRFLNDFYPIRVGEAILDFVPQTFLGVAPRIRGCFPHEIEGP